MGTASILSETATEKAAREAREALAAQLGKAETAQEEGIFSKIIGAIVRFIKLIFGIREKDDDAPDEVAPDPNRPPPTVADKIKLGAAMVSSNAIPKWRDFTRAHAGEKIEHRSPVGEDTQVTSPYGMRIHPIHGDRRMHHGVDLAPRGSDRTPDVVASAKGIVIFSGYINGYGNLVAVGHADGKYSVYAHLHEREMAPMGDKVAQGQKIGVMSRSGDSTGIHLHYEQREGNNSLSPEIAGAKMNDGVRIAGARSTSDHAFAALANRDKLPKLATAEGGKPQALAFAPGASVKGGSAISRG